MEMSLLWEEEAAVAAEAGVAGGAKEGKCSVVVERQQRG